MAGAGYKSWVDGDILTAADVNTYLMQQAVMVFADAAARTTALPTPSEGMVSFLKDTNEIAVYDGSAWVVYAGRGYQYVQTVYFTSSGTFTKATYPWLRAVRVKVQGAGGGSGGTETTGAGEFKASGGGGAGGYGESFILATSLSASETVTVGAGGAGGAAGANNGSNGGSSSFGTHVTANGGDGSSAGTSARTSATFGNAGGQGGTATGDFTITGSAGGVHFANPDLVSRVPGAMAFLSTQIVPITAVGSGLAGVTGRDYGGGAGNSANAESQGTARAGGTGGAGIVIVELYA